MIENRRSRSVEMLTGVDDDVATMLYEQLSRKNEVAEHERGTVIATIVPPRSLWHAISTSHPRLADDLATLPMAADAVMQVTRATWEFAFRSGRDVRNVEIRDTRYAPEITGAIAQLRFTVTAHSETGEHITTFPPRNANNLWPFICARNEQLADTFLLTPGMPEAAIATVEALRQRAIRTGWPLGQISITNGMFLPTPAGGELHFDFALQRRRRR